MVTIQNGQVSKVWLHCQNFTGGFQYLDTVHGSYSEWHVTTSSRYQGFEGFTCIVKITSNKLPKKGQHGPIHPWTETVCMAYPHLPNVQVKSSLLLLLLLPQTHLKCLFSSATYFVPITCFLLFNLGDFGGRLTASFVQWVSPFFL